VGREGNISLDAGILIDNDYQPIENRFQNPGGPGGIPGGKEEAD
jgi:hypothetical protein